MARSSWILLSLALLAGLYFWERAHVKSESQPSVQFPEPAAHQPAVARAERPPVPPVLGKAVVAPSPQVRAVTPPATGGMMYSQQGLVRFKIENGLAISFGDQILGKLVDGQNLQEGYFKPPPPQPWKGIEIAYAISPDLPHPERVQQAIDYFHHFTPIHFVPFAGQTDAIVFEPGESHCSSYVGRVGGHQPILLSEVCAWQDVLHEVMHALGFVHEHSRTDRDQYVVINWDNIEGPYKDQFAMVPEVMMAFQRGTPFDMQSVMIYPPAAFAKYSTQPTLAPVGEGQIQPALNGMSTQDLERLARLFGNLEK